MELALSLGDSTQPFSFLDKSPNSNKDLGFCMGLGSSLGFGSNKAEAKKDEEDHKRRLSSDQSLQLDLLPFSPVPRSQPSSLFPWLSINGASTADAAGGGLGANRLLAAVGPEDPEETTVVSSPNSTLSSFQMDFGFRSGGSKRKREPEFETERASSRTSDDDGENGSTRKKLRLSKEQSAFLEESFKEHSTLNPKQKLALAEQLNLRPRQVEVWFQNRRARTKLKQTEVDCEYLKRCCETLTEENKRLQKELQELRALKTSQAFYMQLPATTLTMCPSCERVATAAVTAAATTGNRSGSATPAADNSKALVPLGTAKLFPFSDAATSSTHHAD